LREARLVKIQALRERLEAEQREAQGLTEAETPALDDKEQRSFADADARIMLMKRGEYDYAYNAQAAVEAESGVIVAAALTNAAPDMHHLPGLVADIRALRATTALPSTTPTTVSADAGYFSAENIAEDREGIDLLIAAGRGERVARATAGQWYTADCFAYDAVRNVWLCPADKVLAQQQTPPGAMGRPKQDYYEAPAADCAACPLRQQCLQPGEERRLLLVRNRRTTGGMRFKLRQVSARRRYARRKVIVEPIFGQFKTDRGLTALCLRGLVLARGEWLLACLAHNLGKLLRVCALPSPAMTA
jgi:IS5 family transposase